MRLLATALAVAGLANPLVGGDHPDPTALRAHGSLYVSATVSAWAPLFPLYRGRHLSSLKQIGSILPAAPSWAAGQFFAPELAAAPGHRGFLAYFSAASTKGGFCLGVASAARPQGPYRDRGPVSCPGGGGAIDPSPVSDARGRPWLAYRQLGPGGGIALTPLRADGLRPSGPARIVLQADQPWEGGVVEGPTFVRRAGDWYLLYAGGNCCRPPCDYAEGVARATALTGPYVKPGAPWLTAGADLICPGHGTVVRDRGASWLVTHAVRASDPGVTRRVMIAAPLTFGEDGWPVAETAALSVPPVGSGAAAPPPAPLRAAAWSDPFTGRALRPGWQWLWNRVPAQHVRAGALTVGCAAPASAPAFLARQADADRFLATALVAPAGGATALVGVHDKGGALRALELRASAAGPLEARAAAFPRTGAPRFGPWAPTTARGQASARVTVAPGGFVGFQLAGADGVFTPLDAGVAATGAPVTRVALGCHGGGSARFASARLDPLPEPAA